MVSARCRYMNTGEGLHRSVDPTDGRTYLYTQCAAADARRVFACFEQPDLKAAFAWDVVAPAGWEVVSNCATPDPTVVGPGLARWVFPETPPLPTYLAALCAGPFHVVRSEYVGPRGTYPLGVFARASMAEHLDAEEILEITRAGLAHYERAFVVPYPFGKYDQVFVPEFNFGAMENPGVVTFREDAYLYRSRVTEAAREARAMVICHEMAHMWFGDLVTMRWWDDLWLNESFATWAGFGVAASADPVHPGVDRLRPVAEGLGLRAGPAALDAPRGGRRPRARGHVPELRRDHLRQGRLRAQAVGRLRRVRRLPGRGEPVLPAPRVGQRDPGGPPGRAGGDEWTGPRSSGLGCGCRSPG